jgi:hypothetical protein
VQKFTTFAKSENGGKIKTLVTDTKQLALFPIRLVQRCISVEFSPKLLNNFFS